MSITERTDNFVYLHNRSISRESKYVVDIVGCVDVGVGGGVGPGEALSPSPSSS